MKLYCRLCKKHYDLTEGLLRCPASNETAVHPLLPEYTAAEIEQTKENLDQKWNSATLSIEAFAPLSGGFQLAKQELSQDTWEQTVCTLNENAHQKSGRGLEQTPILQAESLTQACGFSSNALVIKQEYLGLSGSHKARHSLTAALYLHMLLQKKNILTHKPPLAIFSCGNAALGASIIAQAMNWPLYTFVPDDVDPEIVALLTNYDAHVVRVKREGSVGEGDPCNNRYREAVDHYGLLPFSCYGSDLWPAWEGGMLLGLEFWMQMFRQNRSPDVVIVQVGGGGLAASLAQSLSLALKLGLIKRMPRFFACQTKSCFPLVTSWDKITRYLKDHPSQSNEKSMDAIAARRAQFFPAWSQNLPHSVAEGILDDTTYDGFEVIQGCLSSGGYPFALDESELLEAWHLVRTHTNSDVSATGTAALAGLVKLRKLGVVSPSETCALLFTGVGTRKAPASARMERVHVIGREESLAEVFGRG